MPDAAPACEADVVLASVPDETEMGVRSSESSELIAVLRSLDADVVIHAVRPVHPEVRSDGRTAAERDEHAAGDVALGEAELRGFDAVDVQLQLGLGDNLVNMHVGRAGYTGDFFREAASDLVIGLRVAADHLKIDGRRKSEIDDLAGDVCRLKEERHVRKVLAQSLAQQNFIVAS